MNYDTEKCINLDENLFMRDKKGKKIKLYK